MKKILLLLCVASTFYTFRPLASETENASKEIEGSHPNPNLTGFFRGDGDNGGMAYVRQIGNNVYWYYESDKEGGGSAFSGTLEGNFLIGKIWELPGKVPSIQLQKTDCVYKISDDFRTMTKRSGKIGRSVFTRGGSNLPPVPSIPMQPGNNVLTGIWDCDDGASTYILEDGSDVIWFSEEKKNNGKRPKFANLFFGKRLGPGISGTWVDVPKGTAMLGNGSMKLRIESPTRIVKVDSGNGYGGKAWTRESVKPVVTITLDDIEGLCPDRLVGGDRDFNGNGPLVKCMVNLYVGGQGKGLLADVFLLADETADNWSKLEGAWLKRIVYLAPPGKTIKSIESETTSKTQFISPPGGFQLLVPGTDVSATINSFLGSSISPGVLASFGIPPTDFRAAAKLISGYADSGNTVVKVPATEGTLVRYFHIVGDTGGNDISDDADCKDDTRIVKIEFNPVKVIMQ